MAMAFNRWVEHAAERRRQQQLLNKAVRRMAHRKLAGAFDVWMEMLEEAKADAARQQHVGSGVALRMAERGVCGAMAAWHSVLMLRRRQARALKHWAERQLAAALVGGDSTQTRAGYSGSGSERRLGGWRTGS